MREAFYEQLREELKQVKSEGLYKAERLIRSPQSSHIELENGQKVLNFCANNYLGLANNPLLIKSAKESLDKQGFGMASVRFICGTQNVHKKLEKKLSHFLEKEDTILYSSCFDANTGLFETLLSKEDAIISDELNHASIIDGVRLCKAKRFRYKNSDMQELREKLEEAKACRHKLIATDGIFSMDGSIAKLAQICDLADEYGALVMLDDSHAVGFMGENGKGSAEHCGVLERIDIITGTLGKALGGASGGYSSGRKEVIDYLRQRSRPYLFSNSLAPLIAESSCTAIDLVQSGQTLRQRLFANSQYFREKMEQAGFELIPGEHPIIPVMLYDAKLAQSMAANLLTKGVYVIGFSYPVVPKGLARIRTQMSAAHSLEDIDFAIEAFIQSKKEIGI